MIMTVALVSQTTTARGQCQNVFVLFGSFGLERALTQLDASHRGLDAAEPDMGEIRGSSLKQLTCFKHLAQGTFLKIQKEIEWKKLRAY